MKMTTAETPVTNRLAPHTNGAQEQTAQITPPQFATYEFHIVGTAPYVMLKFSEKARNQMRSNMEAGGQAKSKRKREPRKFESEFEAAIHRDEKGKAGIPAAAFRKGMISACRLVDFKMTIAKLSIFVEADAYDADDGTPLVWIEGKPERVEHTVRNSTGVVDIRTRAMWKQWSAKLRIMVDAERFSRDDVANLLARLGMQVGVGEGRPDGKESCGMGWGTFRIE